MLVGLDIMNQQSNYGDGQLQVKINKSQQMTSVTSLHIVRFIAQNMISALLLYTLIHITCLFCAMLCKMGISLLSEQLTKCFSGRVGGVC